MPSSPPSSSPPSSGSAASQRSNLDRYLGDLGRTSRLDADQEQRLARAYREGDARAGARLVEANLPFVVHVARRYRRWGIPLDDLVQQGNLGLLEAARRFDADKGCRLVTYAAYWIRAEIRDYVVQNYRIVRLGTTRTERRAIRLHRQEAVASPEDLADKSGMPLRRASKLLPLLEGRDRPLDAPQQHGDGGGVPLLERLEADGAVSPEDALAEAQYRRRALEVVARAFEALPGRERFILEARFLKVDDEQGPPTLKEVGAQLGLTKERVRQLQQRALETLRSELDDRSLAA